MDIKQIWSNVREGLGEQLRPGERTGEGPGSESKVGARKATNLVVVGGTQQSKREPVLIQTCHFSGFHKEAQAGFPSSPGN